MQELGRDDSGRGGENRRRRGRGKFLADDRRRSRAYGRGLNDRYAVFDDEVCRHSQKRDRYKRDSEAHGNTGAEDRVFKQRVQMATERERARKRAQNPLDAHS